MEMETMTDLNQRISDIFRCAFEAHPLRRSDPGLALDSARATAASAVPPGVTGSYDDERLAFSADASVRDLADLALVEQANRDLAPAHAAALLGETASSAAEADARIREELQPAVLDPEPRRGL